MPVYDAEQFESELIDALQSTLSDLPGVTVSSPTFLGFNNHPEIRSDAEFGIRVAKKAFRIFVEIKKTIYPRDAHQMLWRAHTADRQESMSESDENTIPLIAAQSISQGAKEILRKEQFGYFDSGGSLFIQASGVYIYIDKPPPKSLKKTIETLFRGKRSQVVHALLLNAGDWVTVKDIAEAANVSPGTASETLAALERFDWISSRGNGPSKARRLERAGELLSEWAQKTRDAKPPNTLRYFVPRLKADGLMKSLAEVCDANTIKYAITEEAAAQVYSPFLSHISQVTCRLQMTRVAELALEQLGARAVNEGANLLILDTKSSGPFLFRERIDQIWMASPIQVYLDLLGGKGRSGALADHLRETKIGF
tara:strand:- start:17471 stop:18574 length:1104 start_codon:yes stop_codon:yes gene_type:complete